MIKLNLKTLSPYLLLVTLCTTMFNIQNSTFRPPSIHVFYEVSRRKSDYLAVEYKHLGFFYKRGGVCLLRGTS
jgi:hypothetical protein